MSNENYEISGAFCRYDDKDIQEMLDFAEKNNITIENEYMDRSTYVFLIRKRLGFLLCTGSGPQNIDVKVNNIEDLKAFYERENSKLGELL